ncbi:MAG: hypothetical protein ABEI53_00580 [Candidatus Magasanikbacteria bacterium]
MFPFFLKKSKLPIFVFLATVFLGLLFSFLFASKTKAAPSKPTNFEVKATSSCAIRVEWSYSGDSGEVTFEGARKRGSGNFVLEGDLPEISEGNVLYFKDTNDEVGEYGYGKNLWSGPSGEDPSIIPGTEFTYKLRTVGNGRSGWTSEKTITTESLDDPADPENLVASIQGLGNDSGGAPKLDWDAPTNPVEDFADFKIFYSAENSSGKDDGNFGSLQFLNSTLNLNTQYFPDYSSELDEHDSHKFRIRSRSFGGEGCYWNNPDHTSTSSYANGPVFVPAVPYDDAGAHPNPVFSVYSSGGDVYISWNNDTLADNFVIRRSTDRNFPSSDTETISVDGSTDSYVDSGGDIIEGNTYYYQIRAVYNGVSSIYSQSKSTTVGVKPPEDVAFRIRNVTTTKAWITASWREGIPEAGSELVIQKDADLSDGGFNYEDDGPGGDEQKVFGDTRGAGLHRWQDKIDRATSVQYRMRIEESSGESSVWMPSPVGRTVTTSVSFLLDGVAWGNISKNGNDFGVGWLNFNSLPSDDGPDDGSTLSEELRYSVQIHDSGVLSGTAWSDNYGWLSFNKTDLNNCPNKNTADGDRECIAKYNEESGQIRGWARFLSGKRTDSDSWGGWMKLSSTTVSDHDYGIYVSTTAPGISSTTWGGNAIGWSGFKGECGGFCTTTILNSPPEVNNVILSKGSESRVLWTATSSDMYYRLDWEFEDDNNDAQDKYEVRFVDNSGGDSGSVDYSFEPGSSGAKFHKLNNPLGYNETSGNYNVSNTLDLGEDYIVEVRVHDGKVWSDWVSVKDPDGNLRVITPPDYYGPWADFSWTTSTNPGDGDWSTGPVSTGTPVKFRDETDNRAVNPSVDIDSWNWDFESSDVETVTNGGSSNPTVIFNIVPTTVTSTVEDSNGRVATTTKIIPSTSGSGSDVEGRKRPIFREE